MLSVIENLKQGLLKRFHGGIHPATHKTDSNQNPIGRLPLAETFIVPLKQHVGQAGDLLVKVGDTVLKGQALTRGDTGLSVPVHAPTSGTVIAIEDRTIPHPSALSERCVVLQADGKDAWTTLHPMPDWKTQPSHRLLDAIHQAGIVGMGGAGFPTHRKLQSGLEHCEVLIINGAECESYITADDRLMRDHAKEIVAGTEILMHLLQPKITVFAIEDNKPDAINAIQAATAPFGERMMVSTIPTRYPSGGSKQLIELLTGKEVPTHGHSNEIGVIVQNTGTAYAIAQAILAGKPLIERVVTLTGNQVGQKGNYWLPIGTPIEHALAHTQYQSHKKHPRLILGGSLMGFTLPHTQVPIVKTTNCLLLPDTKELPLQYNEMPCIRCGDCAEVCPARLQPQHLFWLSKQQDDEACQQAHLDDCIECGACAYVCPSEIPLVQYYRQSKARIAYATVEQQKADRARQRFEAKKQRAEKEKAQKALRAQQAAEARAQNANASTAQNDVAEALNRVKQNTAPKSAVAAAIARAKAKQAESAAQGQTAPDNSEMMKLREERKRQAREKKAQKAASETTNDPDDKQPAVAAAIARAKARKAQQAQSATTAEAESAPAVTEAGDKKASVAAAIARAKTRKAQQAQNATATEQENAPATTKADDKKAAVAAAIARAKARKAQQEQSATTTEPESAPAVTEADDKKAAVAAAIARAKARKAQQEQSTTTAEPDSAPAVTEADDKKATVAAAIARAKVRKMQQAQNTATAEPESAPVATEADDKKAAVAAAIARAKARKAQQMQNATITEPESAPVATEADDKKAAVAAVIARAKARKTQQAQNTATAEPESVPTVTEADDKKAAVAAAIARAKARKAQQAQNVTTAEPESAPVATEADDKKAAVAAAIARAKARKAQLAAQKHNEEK